MRTDNTVTTACASTSMLHLNKRKNAVSPVERTKVTPAWKNDPGTDSEVELE